MSHTINGPVNGHKRLSLVKPEEVVDLPAQAEPVDVDEVDERPRPVDNPQLPAPGIYSENRQPIVASWLTNRTDFLSTTKHASGRAWYAAAYHGLRVPLYSLRLTSMAPRGACRFVASTSRWVWDREAAPLRAAAVHGEDAEEYMRLAKLRAGRVRLRGLVVLVALTFGAITAATLYVLAPAWLYTMASIAVLALGLAGQQKDAPVIGPAVVRTEVERLTAGVVLRALGAIGNDKINRALAKGGEGIRFTSEIHRDGPGYRADLDLPYGVSAEDIMDKRKALASGLRRKVSCVWPAPDPDEHEGRLVLWVGDRPLNETKKPAWPLAKTGTVDLFRPVPFGHDQRMREISVTLMFASVVVGSIPRMGKTFLMRLFLLIAALDPRAELHAYDFKGTGDFGALESVCHRYRAGEEDEDVEYVLASLRELKDELRRRAKVIKGLPRTQCPESKVTSQLASDKRYGLHPIAVALDECQVAFEHPEHGKEIEAICTDLVKRGPALGIVAMFGTQRPDAKSLPTGISANAVLRFCLKVLGQPANDMVLGTSMYKAGYRATMFSRSDRGVCWMAGEGDDPRIVASAFVDAPMAEAITARARKAREEYGNVTGHALGHGPEKTTGHDVLADVLEVVDADEEKVWCERVAARLASLRPDTYDGWTAANVTAALKPHGISTGQVWGTTDDGEGANRRGITRADITTAVTARKRDRGGE